LTILVSGKVHDVEQRKLPRTDKSMLTFGDFKNFFQDLIENQQRYMMAE
jgi:hypothetical protein